jgi:hypothetical protein
MNDYFDPTGHGARLEALLARIADALDRAFPKPDSGPRPPSDNFFTGNTEWREWDPNLGTYTGIKHD